ncbi:unnamed protein product [Brachionus calyciflorus]|uniref:Reverse transcriptase domain-containing protein n=1 Tax=Brachionus calyciflorus TaxID=104777 RepID=A0A814FYY9_9BILA|nr:unnamed protein product [Brachionus calyciflorus]
MSPWSSPIIVVPKKDGSYRICIDYRKLNQVTNSEKWPLPNILDILNRLKNSLWFSVKDLKSGYWQILMDEKSKEKTAFTTPDGHFEFHRLPFGLKNGPSDFCRIMQMILGDLEFAEVYIDDITIHSIDFISHCKHIKRTELHGAKVIAFVDHAALVYLKSIKNLTGRLARWIIFLQEFDFDIIYKKGSTLGNADALSRPVIDYLVTVEYTEEDEIVISSVNIKEVNQDVWEDANLLH